MHNKEFNYVNRLHTVQASVCEMLPRSIPSLTKEEFEEFQKEIRLKPSKELVETLKRAKSVYESNPV